MRLLARCGDIREKASVADYSRQLVILAAAQVHATLAGPDRADLVTGDNWCACGRKPYQHPVGPRCGTTPMAPPADMYRGSRSYSPRPFKLTCTCAGNGEHERGVFVGCLWTTQVQSEGPGQ